MRPSIAMAFAQLLVSPVQAQAAPAVPELGAVPLAIDGSIGYETLNLGSGNPNSVRPASPSGVSLGAIVQSRFGRGVHLYAPVGGGFRLLYLGSERTTGDTLVTSHLDALLVGGDLGLGVLVKSFAIEAVAGGEFALLSKYKYNVDIPGYLPIHTDKPVDDFYRIMLTLRGVYKFKPDMSAILELSTTATGSYSWYNPGTSETQKDTFSGYVVRVVFRYALNDPPLRKIKPDRGVRVDDGLWVKRESTSGAKPATTRPSARRSAKPPRGPTPGRPPLSRAKPGAPTPRNP